MGEVTLQKEAPPFVSCIATSAWPARKEGSLGVLRLAGTDPHFSERWATAALALSIHRSMSLIPVDTVVSSSSIISKPSRRSRGKIVIIFGEHAIVCSEEFLNASTYLPDGSPLSRTVQTKV